MAARLRPERLVAPADLPVTLDDARRHCRADDADEDGLLALYLGAAAAHFDGWTGLLGLALIRQTWRDAWSGFPAEREIPLALAPLLGLTSLSYFDKDNVERTVPSTDYSVVAGAGGVSLVLAWNASWPDTYERPDAVRVTYDAGFGDAPDSVPAPIRSAILLMTGDLYRNRDTTAPGQVSVVPLSVTMEMMTAPWRRRRLA